MMIGALASVSMYFQDLLVFAARFLSRRLQYGISLSVANYDARL